MNSKFVSWKFERIGTACEGSLGGLVWDGKTMLYAAIAEERILRFDPLKKRTTEFRRYTGRTNGLALGPDGIVYGAQEGGRRVIQFLPDGSAAVTATRFDGRIHNHPSDLAVDRAGRIWFTDPYHTLYAFGPQIFPPLEHASVMRLERDERKAWKIVRMTYDTKAPRAVLLAPDEKTVYVAEGDEKAAKRELRAYPVKADGTLAAPKVLCTFGADAQGAHRGIEGMCLDSDGNIVACSGSANAGPGAMITVFAPSGAVLESHPLPQGTPVKCAFGDARLDSLYVTTAEGQLYRASKTGRSGYAG